MSKFEKIVAQVKDATLLRFHYSQNATHSWLQSKLGGGSWNNENMIANAEWSRMVDILRANGWIYTTDHPTPIDTIYFFKRGQNGS